MHGGHQAKQRILTQVDALFQEAYARAAIGSMSKGHNPGQKAPTDFLSPGAYQEIFEKRRLPRIVAPLDFLSPGHPKLGAGRPACWSDTLRQTWLLAPLDFLRAVAPKNIVPVIVTSEDSASRVTSITHWPVLASAADLGGRVGWLSNEEGAGVGRGGVEGYPVPVSLQAPTSAAAVLSRLPPLRQPPTRRIFRTTKKCCFQASNPGQLSA